MEPPWKKKKNQGSFYVTARRSFVPTFGQGYLCDLVMFLEIELPGKKGCKLWMRTICEKLLSDGAESWKCQEQHRKGR